MLQEEDEDDERKDKEKAKKKMLRIQRMMRNQKSLLENFEDLDLNTIYD